MDKGNNEPGGHVGVVIAVRPVRAAGPGGKLADYSLPDPGHRV